MSLPGPLFIDDHLGWTTRDDEYSQPTAVIQMTTDGRTERAISTTRVDFPPLSSLSHAAGTVWRRSARTDPCRHQRPRAGRLHLHHARSSTSHTTTRRPATHPNEFSMEDLRQDVGHRRRRLHCLPTGFSNPSWNRGE